MGRRTRNDRHRPEIQGLAATRAGIFPGPLLDARRCLRLVRRHAASWGADPNRVGVIGFSAGGHLAAMAATLWNQTLEEERRDMLRRISCRPDFAMMIYPVISMNPDVTHRGTRNQILGSSPDRERELLCSAEKQVTRRTPPVFMAQSLDDAVSCLNSEVMERACRENGVPVRRVLYEKGGHGYGMERRGNPTDAWPLEAEKWLRASGWMPDRAPSPPAGLSEPKASQTRSSQGWGAPVAGVLM